MGETLFQFLDHGRWSRLRLKLLFPVACFFWRVEEWAEAIGNHFEDLAATRVAEIRSPRWYRNTRSVRNG